MVDRHSGTAAAGPSDVVVMGAGIAGLAAATHLARAGRRVTCVEPERFPRARVGESLDWSSPWLLRRLGYRSEELVDQGFATYKCDIEAASPDQAPLAAHPPRILSRRPFGAQMTTVHLDRERFDRSLYERARDGGVEFVWDAVGKVEMEGDRVLGCVTRSGLRLEADWFIDATGPSRLIGRAAGIGVREYAVPRVCLWTQATAPRARAGTTLSLDTTKEQLEWVWEIPLAEDRQSLGLVMPSRAFRALERRGRSKAQILAEQLARFPRYASLEPDDLGEVRTRSYRPYVSDRVVGANWLMAGEAAAMIDPLTSFGVTAALRNGSEAASIITGTHGRAGAGRLRPARPHPGRSVQLRHRGAHLRAAGPHGLRPARCRNRLRARWVRHEHAVHATAADHGHQDRRPGHHRVRIPALAEGLARGRRSGRNASGPVRRH
ncbi:MAG: FAD-dependent oxidoreductase [Chloroflexota bacterium]